MSSTITCDACQETRPARVEDRENFLQLLLPEDPGASRSGFDLLPRRERWDACSPGCLRALVDRYESRGDA